MSDTKLDCIMLQRNSVGFWNVWGGGDFHCFIFYTLMTCFADNYSNCLHASDFKDTLFKAGFVDIEGKSSWAQSLD